MCIIITKHIYKNKIKQIIHNIEYVKYMYQDTFFFFFVVRSALDAWKRKHIYKNKIQQA
jgi:hypothetical protein